MTYTLVADGPSDRVLLPILSWCLKRQTVIEVVEQWADLDRIGRPKGLAKTLRIALDLYPCDVLFVHRDAEAQPASSRREEIANALKPNAAKHVPVVPIRMTEAWLLADETAIRSAAGNPNGRQPLNLPDLRRLEDIPDPKEVLSQALVAASGLNARRRSSFRTAERIQRIPAYIDDYSKLDALQAFQALQEDIRAVIGRG